MASSRDTSARRVRVRINPIRCVAFGYCAEFSPEVFSLDDWGYASIIRNDVNNDLLALLKRTASLCPTSAISVEQIDAPAAAGSVPHDRRPLTLDPTRKKT